jgi:hypothetical protein
MPRRKAAPPAPEVKQKSRAVRKAVKEQERLPALVANGALAWEAAKLMRAGKSVPEVAAKLNLSEAALTTVMKDALRQMHEQAATIVANWTTLNLSRQEEIISRLWDNMFDSNNVPNADIIGMVQDAIMMEQKILAFSFAKMGDKQSTSVVQNVTIVNNGDPTGLFMEAQRAMNMNMRTEEGEFKDPIVSELDDAIPGGIVYLPRAKND